MPTYKGIQMSQDVYELSIGQFKEEPPAEANKLWRSANKETLELAFDAIWSGLGGDASDWAHSALFDAERNWEIDRYNEALRIGVEIHGGQYMRKKSGHSNPGGLRRDYQKANRCRVLDIDLFQLSTDMVNHDEIAILRKFYINKRRTHATIK